MKKEQLSALTVKELKAMAKENDLKGCSKLRKAELVEMLAVEVTFEEVALEPETIFAKIENGTYKVLKTEGNEWQLLDENKNILEDVYVNNGYTNDFKINVDGISYDKTDIEHNNAINKACNLKLSHETLSMLSELAYYKCADEGSMTEGIPLSTRIENTVKDFAIKHSQNEKLVIDNNLSVCLHTMTIYKDDVSIEMEFWYPLIEELGFA